MLADPRLRGSSKVNYFVFLWLMWSVVYMK